LQRRLVRQAVHRLRPGFRDLDYAAVERAVSVIHAGGQCDLVGGLRLLREGSLVWVAAWEAEPPAVLWEGLGWPQLAAGQEIELPLSGATHLPGGWQMVSHQAAATPDMLDAALANQDPYQADLDADRLTAARAPLRLRVRRPGDRFQPLGLEGHTTKLSDFFINQKLPRRARALWPLLDCGGTIAWIPGLRLAHPFRLNQGTTRLVHLRLIRE